MTVMTVMTGMTAMTEADRQDPIRCVCAHPDCAGDCEQQLRGPGRAVRSACRAPFATPRLTFDDM